MAVLVPNVVLADFDFVHWDTLDLFEAATVEKAEACLVEGADVTAGCVNDETVNGLTKSGLKFEVQFPSLATPLHWADSQGNAGTVNALLDASRPYGTSERRQHPF